MLVQPTMLRPRSQSIDAFRGITILVMIFVNELAGIRDIPMWMKHMPADADAMTFVDLVFPAFLFIVGMSIPFAIAARKRKGNSFLQLQGHILFRTIGLLILGVFMVNADEGYNAAATGLSHSLWSLLFYCCIIAIWNVYSSESRLLALCMRLAGMAGLLVLGYIYRGGENGDELLQPRWWGILGLIGWAYLFSVIIFQLTGQRWWLLLICMSVCLAFYCIAQQPTIAADPALSWMGYQSGNAAHTSIVLAGLITSQLIFTDQYKTTARKLLMAAAFAIVTATIGFVLRPYFGISKIYATPSWCLFSAAICVVIFIVLYWTTDIKRWNGWTSFFQPAAANPLLVYILPAVVYAIAGLIGVSIFPDSLRYGLPGLVWSLLFAVAMMGLAAVLNRLKIRLQL